jgi:hypothetical protein
MIRFTQQPFALRHESETKDSQIRPNANFHSFSPRLEVSGYPTQPLPDLRRTEKSFDYFWLKLILLIIGGFFVALIWQKYVSPWMEELEKKEKREDDLTIRPSLK